MGWRWKRRLLMAAFLILGLMVGAVGGYYAQKELKQNKVSSSAKKVVKKTHKTTPSSQASSPEAASAPAATSPPAPVSTSPPATGATPVEAMRKYLQQNGVTATNTAFAVVSSSRADANWKIDKGTTGAETRYFLLHYANGTWSVVASGTSLTAAQLQSASAPGDLKPVP